MVIYALMMKLVGYVSVCGMVMASVPGAAQVAASPVVPARPVLVELFTSEGCSSCPPADRLLRELDGMRTPHGERIVALSEHVTYWNQLGWVDPFSQDKFTDRQNVYSDKFLADEVYTPQAVVNGARGVLGSDRAAVLDAVLLEGDPLPVGIEVLSYRPNGPNLSVIVMLSGTLPAGGVELYAALADDRQTRHVLRGENIGMTLTHVAVARGLAMVPVHRAGEQTLLSIPVSPEQRATPEGGRRLVVFAQKPGQGRVVGVTEQEIAVEFPTTVAKPAERGRTLEAR